MSLLIPILTGLYRRLLNLYTRSFRAEFGEELLDVFEQALKVPLTKFSSRFRLTQRFGKGRIMSLYFSLLLTIAAMSMMGMFRRVWSWAAIGKREI